MKLIIQLTASNKTLIKGNNKIQRETGSPGLSLTACTVIRAAKRGDQREQFVPGPWGLGNLSK